MPPRHPLFDDALQLVRSGRVTEGLLLLNELAAADDALAINALAEMKWSGVLDQDPVAARRLFERAAALGHRPAIERTTNLLASGLAGPRDWAGAVIRLREEADRQPARRHALELVEEMNLDDDGDPIERPAGTSLSASPSVTRFDRAFTARECDYLRTLNEQAFKAATVFDKDRKPMRDPIRTSDEKTINWLIEDPAVHALNRRLAAISGTAPEQAEAAQILRYQPGQQYRAHYDFLPGAPNQRVATILVYLNDDFRGGETIFLKPGLKITPVKGDAILFTNMHSDGSRDEMAEHAGLPVESGTKFLLSRWIRARRWAP